MTAFFLFRFTGQGVEFVTPVLAVTVHYLFIGLVVVGAVAYRRQVVRVRREMRKRQEARRGVLTVGK